MKQTNYSQGIVFVRKAQMYLAYRCFNVKDRTDAREWYKTKQEAQNYLNTL